MYLIIYEDGGAQQTDDLPISVQASIIRGAPCRLFHIPPSGDLTRELYSDGTWNVVPILP